MEVESPLKGWPETKQLEDGSGFRIRAKYIPPERIRLVDYIAGLICTGIFFWVLIELASRNPDKILGAFLAASVAAFISAFVIAVPRQKWGRVFFGRTTIIEFLPDKIRVKNGSRFLNYSRNLPHEFDYIRHDKAQDEQDREADALREAQRKGKRVPEKAQQIFRRSFHIVLRYAGQRVDIASIFGQKDAEALLVRLQLLDQLMDAARGASTASPYAQAGTQYGERPAAG